jgi:hypothetical protein
LAIVPDWLRLPGTSRSYVNPSSGQIISRRQYDEQYGRLARQGFRNNEEQAKSNAAKRVTEPLHRDFGEHVDHGKKGQRQVTVLEPTVTQVVSPGFLNRITQLTRDRRRQWKIGDKREMRVWVVTKEVFNHYRSQVRGIVILMTNADLIDIGDILSLAINNYSRKFRGGMTLMIKLILRVLGSGDYSIVSPMPTTLATEAILYWNRVLKRAQDNYRASSDVVGGIWELRTQ